MKTQHLPVALNISFHHPPQGYGREGGAAPTTATGKLLRFDHKLNGFFFQLSFKSLISLRRSVVEPPQCLLLPRVREKITAPLR